MENRDDDILTEIEDQAPSCAECGCTAQWIECETCDGVGYDPRDTATWTPCPACDEDCGEWYCERCTRRVA